MASATRISLEIEPIIKPGVANLCLAALELFMNQNPEIDIIGERLPDGSIHLKVVERKESEPSKENNDETQR